ncbi:SMRP1 protein, partial [Galbula dea]|nr:SMRP1 protein [Galbula dea]
MFLFSKKHKTPISTYTDSYRPPCSVKKTNQEQTPDELWREDKFVTQGLMVPLVQNLASRGQPEKMVIPATRGYYRTIIDPAAYRPRSYWLDRSEEKYSPVFVKEDKYVTWRTGPYNSAAWNKHSSYLPLLPKGTIMETFLHSTPMLRPLKLICVNQSEREAVTKMLRRLPVYTVRGKEPFQGYYSPCSGRLYCLRGMDYYVDGTPGTRRHLHTQDEKAVSLGSILCCGYSPRAMFCTSIEHPHPPSSNYSTAPRWNTSHFMKAGRVQRAIYVIHPEFASEAY